MRLRACVWLGVVCGWSSVAAAQQPCGPRGGKLFEVASQSRRALEDYQRVHQRFEQTRADERLVRGEGEGLEVSQQLTLEAAWWFGLRVCEQGVVRPAALSSGRASMLVGLEHRQTGLRGEAFVVAGWDSASRFIPREGAGLEDEELRDTRGLVMAGGRAQAGRWAELVVGVIEDARPARAYVALGVPALKLRADLVVSPEDRQAQTLQLALAPVALGEAGWAVSGQAGYLEDEAQVFTQAALKVPLYGEGARELWGSVSGGGVLEASSASLLSVIPELSMEWRGVGVRHARARLQWESVSWGAVEAGGAEGLGRMELWVDGTMFGGAELARRVDKERAWGGSIGFRAGRIAGGAAGEGVRLAWGVEGQVAAARPELLAQAPELALANAELRLGGFLSLQY